MSIRGVWDINQSVSDGRTAFSFWRKTPSQTNTGNMWFDLSMSPGNPPPQYYAAAPLVAQQLKRSTDGGLYHGSNVTPQVKYLKRFLAISTSGAMLPMSYTLCDYLLYYPFVDMGTNDEQIMDNTLTLPRYTDGVGVQMMAVSVAAGSGLLPTFTVNYTNSDGVAGRTSRTITLNTATANGSILNNNPTVGTAIANSAFIGLQSGDKGVRSVQSVTFPSTLDIGLFALVLVKPLMTSCLLEQAAPSETEPLIHHSGLPRIYDDAFLSLICLPNGSLSGVGLTGEIETVWNI